MKTINELQQQAEKAGFEEYSNFWNEIDPIRIPEKCHHLIMTCIKGQFDNEVIDILYSDSEIFGVEITNQRFVRNAPPKFRFSAKNIGEGKHKNESILIDRIWIDRGNTYASVENKFNTLYPALVNELI